MKMGKSFWRRTAVMMTGVIGMGICLSLLLKAGHGVDSSSFMNSSIASYLKTDLGPVMLAVNIVLNLILMWPLRQGGIALATVLSSMLNNAILLTCLHREGFQLQGRKMVVAAGRALLLSLAVGMPLFFFYPLLREYLSFRFVGEFPAFCVLALCFGAGYFGLNLLFRAEEPREFFGMLRHRS